jgi:hypothetical protein
VGSRPRSTLGRQIYSYAPICSRRRASQWVAPGSCRLLRQPTQAPGWLRDLDGHLLLALCHERAHRRHAAQHAPEAPPDRGGGTSCMSRPTSPPMRGGARREDGRRNAGLAHWWRFPSCSGVGMGPSYRASKGKFVWDMQPSRGVVEGRWHGLSTRGGVGPIH